MLASGSPLARLLAARLEGRRGAAYPGAALLLLLCACRSGSTCPPVASPVETTFSSPAVSPTPTAPGSNDELEALGQAIEGGELHVQLDLRPGCIPVAGGWSVEVGGSPTLSVEAGASAGRVERLDAAIAGGTLEVSGRGLRPRVRIESLRFEGSKGLVDARFRGRGIWRPIVGIFRGVAMSAIRKLRWKTDIPSVLHGDVLETASAAPPPVPTTSAAPPPPPGPSFLDLLREARIHESSLRAFAGRSIAFGEIVSFRTGTGGVEPLRLEVSSGSFRPGAAGAPPSYEFSGSLEGAIENGAVTLAGARSEFSRGRLEKGRFTFRSTAEGREATIRAALFSLELSSGRFHVPGGPVVAVDAPSRFAIRDLAVRPDGTYSGIVTAELSGKVGTIERAGTTISASNVTVRAPELRVTDGKATGDVDLQFDYEVDYVLSIAYPIPELARKRVPLAFHGPFTTRLHLENAGADTGSVTGDYAFKVPWAPVEQAALEALRARWVQDAPVVQRVNFDIEPRRFAPCGENCLLLDLEVTAEKKKAKKSIFRQICEPQGRADLVVDAPTRSFQLRNIKIETRCKGVIGWVVNFLSPFLTKSYTDMVLFRMPENLPFTIEKVGSGMQWLAIAGRVDYEQGKPAPTPR